MREYLLPLSFFLMPYQVFGISIFSTRLDLSVILIIFWLFQWLPKRNLTFIITTFIFLTSYSFLFAVLFENPFSLTRIMSASFFYSLIINCLFIKKNLNAEEIKYSRIAIFCSLINCVFLKFIQPLLPTIFENQGFKEASFANLFYCSILIFGILSLLKKKLFISSFLIIGSTSLLLQTRGIHFISFTLTFVFIFISLNLVKTKNFLLRPKYLNKFTLYSLIGIISFLPIFYIVISSGYFIERILTVIESDALENASLSGLVWLGGLNQAKEAFLNCGIFGCGSGSPGVFSEKIFIPIVTNTCEDCYAGDNLNLNRYDCYSLLFRSFVEYGFLSLILWSIIFKNLIIYLSRVFEFDKIKFNLDFTCFLLTFLIGSLIKEPHLYSSITFLPLVILTIQTNPFNLNFSWIKTLNKNERR